MRRSLSLAALAATVGLASCADQPVQVPAAPADELRLSAEEAPIYIVTFHDGVGDVQAAARDLARGNGFALRFVREHAARGFSAVIPASRLDAVRNDPRVALVERNGIASLPRPVVAARPGSGGSGGQTTPWGIARVGGFGDGTGKRAWVLDTGVDLDHPDLTIGTGCHVAYEGRTPDDGNGHGTHVAGIIAARNNGIDVVGVAAGATVCSVRVLGNSGSGSWESIINGVNFVAANGSNGDVANLSLGGSGHLAALETALKDLAATGVRVVMAAGNEGVDAGTTMPGRYNGNNLYTVSAVNSSDCMPSWSNWGDPPVDYAAPGVSILSLKKGGGTTTYSGTSQAAPHVAGILLLGGVRTDGGAQCDRDGSPDPIAHR